MNVQLNKITSNLRSLLAQAKARPKLVLLLGLAVISLFLLFRLLCGSCEAQMGRVVCAAFPLEAGVVLSALIKMELKGIITQLPGKMFVR